MDHVDTCIAGAGIIGLAIARRLSDAGREVLVLDREIRYGQGISSRNSEVIHAGIYYSPESLKARFCVRGKALLYQYCRDRRIPYQRCGKLIVATEKDEEEDLDRILARAQINGVDDLEYWSGRTLAAREPAVRATLGLYSPSTGIVDTFSLMTALLADVESAGGTFSGGTQVEAVDIEPDRFVIHCQAGTEPFRFSCRVLINAAGLGARALASRIAGLEEENIPPLHLCKGSYFIHAGSAPFRRLVYPVPEKSGAGLGIHATLDTAGQLRFGPDVEYVPEEDYCVSPARAREFCTAIRRYYPGLQEDRLVPGYAGIRPKLQGPGESPADFLIQGPRDHGIQGLIQLFGIESPGLTSSLAIADHVNRMLENDD